MSVLDINKKLNGKILRADGFSKIGWGSPSTRKELNTTCYEKLIDDINEEWVEWDVIWFPKTFEGAVVVHWKHMLPSELHERVLMSKNQDNPDYYLSPVLKNKLELDMWVEQVMLEKVEKFHPSLFK